MPDDEEQLLAGAVTLHNHPAMTPTFSAGDLMMAVKYGAPRMCLAWRTGLGGALSRQHIHCITQEEALAALMDRVPLHELRARVAEGGSQ